MVFVAEVVDIAWGLIVKWLSHHVLGVTVLSMTCIRQNHKNTLFWPLRSPVFCRALSNIIQMVCTCIDYHRKSKSSVLKTYFLLLVLNSELDCNMIYT